MTTNPAPAAQGLRSGEAIWSHGPWTAHGEATAAGANILIGDSDGELVAHAVTRDIGAQNAEANARLIAAAPELYDVLYDITFWLDLHSAAPLKQRALAALARARGEQ